MTRAKRLWVINMDKCAVQWLHNFLHSIGKPVPARIKKVYCAIQLHMDALLDIHWHSVDFSKASAFVGATVGVQGIMSRFSPRRRKERQFTLQSHTKVNEIRQQKP